MNVHAANGSTVIFNISAAEVPPPPPPPQSKKKTRDRKQRPIGFEIMNRAFLSMCPHTLAVSLQSKPRSKTKQHMVDTCGKVAYRFNLKEAWSSESNQV
jgi:hypothetical protein